MNEKLEILKEKYNLNERILDLTIDVAFKKVFTAKENRWYLAFLISYCTKLDINYILKNMKMKNDFISSSNIKMKTGYSDILVEVDKKIINIEMNRNLSEKLIRKNKWYVNTLSSVSAEKNSKLDKLIIQINISTKARIPKTNELLYEIVRMDKNLKVEDVYNSEIIYDINLEYLKEELYNKNKINKEEKRLLIFIEQDKKILESLYKGDVKMKEIVNEVEEEKYKNDYSFLLEYDKEALDEEIRQDELKKAREESYNEGIRNNKIEIAKKLLEMNIPEEEIEKLIGMPLEKLENPDYTDEIKIPTYDKEALDEEIRQDELKKAREESYNEGILCLANKLIKMNIPKEKIEKAIGMPLEKLEDPDYTDEIKIPTYDKEALHEGIRQDELKKAKEESYNEGTINEKREIAKKLLEMNIAKKDIEKAIGMLLENLLNN